MSAQDTAAILNAAGVKTGPGRVWLRRDEPQPHDLFFALYARGWSWTINALERDPGSIAERYVATVTYFFPSDDRPDWEEEAWATVEGVDPIVALGAAFARALVDPRIDPVARTPFAEWP